MVTEVMGAVNDFKPVKVAVTDGYCSHDTLVMAVAWRLDDRRFDPRLQLTVNAHEWLGAVGS